MSFQAEFHVLLQALVALLLGGIQGWEREAAGKWAGLRTHMLLCLAAMLFVRLGRMLIGESAEDVEPAAIRADPVHIIAAVATGISFLGAGTIFREHSGKSRGLTTAAGLLVTACIGIAVAMDRYIIASGVTLICLFVQGTLRRFERKVLAAPKEALRQEEDGHRQDDAIGNHPPR